MAPAVSVVGSWTEGARRASFWSRSVSWGLAFRLRQSVAGSLWLLPALAVVGGAVLSLAVMAVDRVVPDLGPLVYSAPTAVAVLSANIGAMAALAGFVVTVTVLAVQLATSSFSARYMRLWYRDLMLKGLLAWLVGTMTYSYMAVRFVEEDFVPDITVTLAAVAVLVSLVYFVVYFDRVLHRLRPVAVAAQVAEQGHRAFEAWRQVAERADTRLRPQGAALPTEPATLVVHSRRAGCIQAIDLRGLTAFAVRQRCLIVFHHTIGDFVPREAPLLSVYGGRLPTLAAGRLGSMVAMGDERTIEQDPLFAVRVMVDIASRALSPGINDPTTATQVLDLLGETLRMVGTAEFPEEDHPATTADHVVSMPLRGWEEYLTLGVTEIREFGAGSVQVLRRLRALLLELEELVPDERRAAVEEQLRRLDATTERAFGSTEDRDLATRPDVQGIGGPARPAVAEPTEGSTPID